MKYGLCASIWSENVGRVHRVAQQLLVSDDIMYHTIPYQSPLTRAPCSSRLVQYGATAGFCETLTCLLVELKLRELGRKGISNL